MRQQLLLLLFCLFSWSTVQSQSVTSLTLVNANTNTDIGVLQNGQMLNLATLPTTNLNVRANTNPATVGSVRFALDGNANFQTENVAPYALKGDTNGDYKNWTPSLGDHTLTATPFSGSNAGGTAGTALTINFTVIDEATSLPDPPTNLIATALSDTEIYLDWDDPALGNDYAIERSLSPTSGFAQVDASYYGDSQHTSSGLDPNTTYYFRVKVFYNSVASPYSAVASATTQATPEPSTVLYAINAGGAAFTAADGTEFTADRLVSGGRTYKGNASISGTTDDFIYQSERYGNFTYNLPVSDGTYEVTLLFAEVYFNAPNKRVFDVKMEGTEEISNLDLYATVGKNAAYQITKTVNVTDGNLTLAFSADVNNAKLAGLLVSGEGSTNPEPGTATVSGELRKWHKVTLSFDGPNHSETDNNPNPFLDYRLNVTFSHSGSGKSHTVPGYFANDGNAAESSATSGNQWKVHFRPDETGTWNYSASFRQGSQVAISTGASPGTANSAIDGISGSLEIQNSNKSGRDFRAKGRLEYVGKHYLQFAETGEYFVKGGSDAPENFLAYDDFDNTPNSGGRRKSWSPHASDWNNGDPDWKGNKGREMIGALNYLASEEANVFSFLTMNINGDDKNVYPYVSSSDFKHFDVSKLDQWEVVFEHAQELGLYLHFKTQETENDQLLDGGDLGTNRKLYYRMLVARFGHHLALNWNLGEENDIWQELNDPGNNRIKSYAQYIQDIDPYDHHIVIHTYPGQQDEVYDPLIGNKSRLTGASVQTGYSNVYRDTKKWVDASEAAGKPWVVANDEQGSANIGVPPDLGYTDPITGDTYNGKDLQGNNVNVSQDDIRKKTLWGNLMAGGAGVEYYYGYRLPQSDLTLQDYRSRDKMWDYTRYALQFFNQHLPFWEMTPDNNLVNNGWCLAKAGEVYAVYLENGGSTNVSLGSSGTKYDVRWYNPRSGGNLQTGSKATLTATGSVSVGNPPNSSSQDWVVLLKSQGSGSNTTVAREEVIQIDGMTAYPVPLQEQLTVSFDSEKTAVAVEITDFSGNVLRRIEKGYQQAVDLSTIDLTPGAYYLRVIADGKVYRSALLK
ncbi:malectin domain-containing carbohydrate-binding protein [Tunicatimonas pelagia]|uniref:malectin domain-containing carbohydrate-binding protein n=1 Tax=Tunicatimonas pelagia TaxID=931531 RepID=UPI0026666A36|nr:malectin domain-containing carbohydrate-binding protein [Tunicatimonas pelagia]WKN43593.1 malectin domain-containing carbohydrate-binding protein [Tunicatimonas pelagia]